MSVVVVEVMLMVAVALRAVAAEQQLEVLGLLERHTQRKVLLAEQEMALIRIPVGAVEVLV